MLTHDTLDEWQRWHARRVGPMHQLKHRVVSPSRILLFHENGTQRTDRPVVVSVDSLSFSQVTSLIRPMQLLQERGHPAKIIAPVSLSAHLNNLGFRPATDGP